MLDRETAIVKEIIFQKGDIQELKVLINNEVNKAINYPLISGKCKVGDKVLLNTTAMRLKLGTGGYHYVISNVDNLEEIHSHSSHIMKMRYSPMQIVTQTMEEQNSPYHEAIKEFKTLSKMPVIVGALHSMLAPAVAIMKYHNPTIKIAYIMSDGASLPISFSKTVRTLKEKKLINSTITYGHAFGGDFEAVNIYTALIGAKEVAKCDLAIVAMGPGIVGTGTQYGFTGLEQGNIVDAVHTLGGKAIGIPRISFSDKRKRHYGISHHFITTFTKITKTSSLISFPNLEDLDKDDLIRKQISANNLNKSHDIAFKNTRNLEDVLNEFNLKVSTMGRDYKQDPEFFQAAAAAGLSALEYLQKKENNNEL